MLKPYLIAVTGRPGAGKSTFAHALGQRAFLPVISRDEIKEGYVHTFGKSHAELPEGANAEATRRFFDTAERLLDGGVSLIAEAAFQHKLWTPWLESMKCRARIILMICQAGDGSVELERFVQRGLENPLREYFHGDKDVDMARRGLTVKAGPYEPPHLDVPTYSIDTAGEYHPSMEQLLHEIFGW